MVVKDKSYHQRYGKRYFQDNKERLTRLSKKLKQSNKEENIKWLCNYLGVDKISCERCGYNKHSGAIDGHHLDPNQKEFMEDIFSRWIYRTPKFFIKKILSHKLKYLCKNCHVELHDGLWQVDAEVTQQVEFLPSKQISAGSNPAFRSKQQVFFLKNE